MNPSNQGMNYEPNTLQVVVMEWWCLTCFSSQIEKLSQHKVIYNVGQL
jgi:hypothetical protein